MDTKEKAQFQQMQRALVATRIPRTLTTAGTVTLTDYLVACDATSAGFTVTLPAVLDAKGMSLLIVKTDSSSNAVTIDGNASETINGATTLVLSRQWNGVMLYCDGTQWITVIPSALIAATLALSGNAIIGGTTVLNPTGWARVLEVEASGSAALELYDSTATAQLWSIANNSKNLDFYDDTGGVHALILTKGTGAAAFGAGVAVGVGSDLQVGQTAVAAVALASTHKIQVKDATGTTYFVLAHT